MTRIRFVSTAVATFAVASAVLVSLTGCGLGPLGPGTIDPVVVPSPAATPSSSPSPAISPVSMPPASRFDGTCSDLATPASLAAVLRGPVAVHDPAVSDLASDPILPDLYTIRQVGGMVCEWTNGVIQGGRSGLLYDYIGARVDILPDAASQWTRYADYYEPATNRDEHCQPIDTFACTLDAYVNGFWVHSYIQGLTGIVSSEAELMAVADRFFDAVLTRVTASSTSGTLPALDPAILRLPADCDSLVTPAQVQAAIATATPLVSGRPFGGWSLGAGARENAGDGNCHWGPADADVAIGTLDWIPGGGWAVDEIAAADAGSPWALATARIPGLTPQEHAITRCITGDEECFVDFDLGGNLVEVSVLREDLGSPSVGLDRRLAAVAIATAVVANLRH